jgi:hypothetical protein
VIPCMMSLSSSSVNFWTLVHSGVRR